MFSNVDFEARQYGFKSYESTWLDDEYKHLYPSDGCLRIYLSIFIVYFVFICYLESMTCLINAYLGLGNHRCECIEYLFT
jgi:hypothetical protein